jgi:hypothetical protein
LHGDGEIDELEEKQNDLVMEAEDDVIAITISFTLVQVIRFVCDHQMPNVEGVYEEDEDCRGPYRRVLSLVLVGAVFAALVMKKPIRFLKKRHKRIVSWMKGIWSTGFAWSIYFANYWWVRVIFGHYDYKMVGSLNVCLALVNTCAAFLCIFVLERLEGVLQDQDIQKGVKKLNLSLAILVGFSWEKGFDVAIDLIGERVSSSVFGESARDGAGVIVLIISVVLCAMVLPAWKWFIFPIEQEFERRLEVVARFGSVRDIGSMRGLDRGSPDGSNGDYIRLPGTPPPGARSMSPSRSLSPRSPTRPVSEIRVADMGSLRQRVDILSSHVAKLRALRLQSMPEEQGNDVAVKCTEWMSRLEAEATNLGVALVDSKLSIEEQMAHQAQMEKSVLEMRRELHAAYLQFWGVSAG